MRAPGFHRFAVLFAALCVAGWFHVLNESWGLVPALVLCLPTGIVFSLIPPAVVGTIRPVLGDVFTTWAFIAAGIALAVYAFAALEGVAFTLVGLAAAAVFFGGSSLFYVRLNADRRRISTAD